MSSDRAPSNPAPDQVVTLEKQVQSMRIGLKACCLVGSVFLSLKLYLTVSMIGPARDMFSEMGAASLPRISLFLFSHHYLPFALLILSLASLVGIILACLRFRNGAFLVVFAVSLVVHLLLISWIDLAIKLPFLKIVQDLQSF